MAKHAADLELIQGQAVADVADERSAEAKGSTLGDAQEIVRVTPDQTVEAIAAGELHSVLRNRPEGPPNVIVEPATRDATPR
jgi:outer membrane receptor for monomeric catechols